MKKYNFKEYNQTQAMMGFIVPCDLLEDSHPACLLDKVVEKLDLSAIYEYYSYEGNPSYHPKMMLKVLLYSYMKGDKSCRVINNNLISGRADYYFHHRRFLTLFGRFLLAKCLISEL